MVLSQLHRSTKNMSADPKSDIDRVVDAIGSLSFNTGKTNREVRDKLEAATKEVAGLTSEIADSRKELSQKMTALAHSIDRHSASSSALTKVIIVLTVILAVTAVISAVTPFLKKESNQPPQRNAGSPPSSGDSPAIETPSSLGPRG